MDMPVLVEYPNLEEVFHADSTAAAADFAFTDALREESELLGRALRIWSPWLKPKGKLPLAVGLHAAGSGKCDFSFVLDMQRSGFDLEELLQHPEIRRVLPSVYQGRKIYTVYFHDRKNFAVAAYRNLLIMAALPLRVEEAIGRLEWRPSALWTQAGFRQVLPGSRDGANIRLFVQPAQLAILLSGVIHPEGRPEVRRWAGIADWIRLDLRRHEDGWGIGGTMLNSKKEGWIQALQNRQQILLQEHLEVIPDNIALLFLASVSNWSPLQGKGNALFRRHIASWAGRELALAMAQPKGIDLPSDWFAVISVRNTELAERRLSELASESGLLKDYEYQTFQIRQLMTGDLLPFFPAGRMDNPFFVFLGDYVVFASAQAALEVWVDAYIAGKTLASDEAFLPLYAGGKEQGAWFFYLPADKIKPLLQTFAPGEPRMAGLADVLGTLAIRATQEGRHWKLSGEGATFADAGIHSGVAWKALLAAPAIGRPLIVEDTANAQTCIAVQDSNFRLYLLGPTGDIRWTRVLDGPLLSDVQHMDYYGDGSTVMLMNTARNIYALDMQGNEVGNFPLPLQSPATNGVTAVNFDGGLQLSFFIACANGNLYGFDRMGRPLPGWNPLPGAGILRFPLIHFYKEDKDYLVTLNDKGLMKVYRRDGGERLPPKKLEGDFLSPPAFQVSENSNRIVAVNTSGIAHVVGLKDEFFRIACSVGQGKDTRFAFCELSGDERKDYAVLSGEELALYAYGRGNDFGKVFTHRFDAPQDDVFCIRLPGEAKDRIGTVSRKAGQIFLLDESGSVYPGFPLAGHSRFFAADLYRTGTPVVVTIYGDSVYAYQIK